MAASCTCAPSPLAYTGILSESYAAPRIRQRGFFVPVMGEFRLSFSMGDEEARITNTAPGFITAESESPAPQKNGRFSLKIMEATMASNTLSVDPRVITPLICSPEDPARFPKDSLHRVAITLELLSELIGNYNGQSELLESEDHRFAMSMQLSGAAQVLEVVGEALQIRKPMTRKNEVIIEFASDELEKLSAIAERDGKSVGDTVQGIVIDALTAFDPSRRNGEGAQ